MNKEGITFELAGGIGNQLFQISAGLSFAIQKKTQVKFDVSRIGAGTSNRKENILSRITLSNASRVDYSVVSSKVPLIIDSISTRSKLANRVEKKLRRIHTATTIGYDSEIYELHMASHVRGYFQTYRYLDDLRQHGVDIAFDSSHFSRTFLRFDTEIDYENDLAVHVRRGDYLQHSNSIGLLHDSYFKEGIRKLEPISRIFVFSDEPSLRLSGLDRFEIVYARELTGMHPLETIVIMSKFKNLVISNSTFSWWAASLARRDKNVICPEPWFRNITQPQDIIPDGWNCIKSSWVTSHE